MHNKNKPKKKRLRRSRIWLELSDTEFSELVKKSDSIGHVLEFFNLDNVGRNHHTIKARIVELGLSVSHFTRKPRKLNKFDLKEALVEHSKVSRGTLKRHLLNNDLLDVKCAICGLGTEWKHKPLVLVLDHINGVHNDNRLENLRLLCPNCNSQTDTFAGRNNK